MLAKLQNLVKRDPETYREEYIMQRSHFESEINILELNLSENNVKFTEYLTFFAHTSAHFKDSETNAITERLITLLDTNAMILHPDVRYKLFTCLIIMRNKSIIDPIIMIKLSFKLFCVNDKALRVTLSEYIFNDIKNMNLTKHNEKLNRSIQSILYNVVKDDTTIAAKKTVEILSELYRRRVWTDARTINVIAMACVSPSSRVMVVAIKFFLGIETKMNEDEDEEKQAAVQEIDYHEHSKKTKKRQRHIEKQVDKNAKLRRDAAKKYATAVPLFPAIQILYDPLQLTENLIKKLKSSNERFEVKLLMMNFISRLIGCHKLIIYKFYSFLQKYLTSHQAEVTHILAYLIQSCHDLVPPEELLPVVKAIAYNFITERCRNEVITVGINSIREIFVRVPTLLKEPDMADFIQDLAMYGKKTHKSVMVAAHSVINLVRELYPALLRKGDRGKFHNIKSVPKDYGDMTVSTGVEGIHLLEAYERGDIYINSDDEICWKADDGKYSDDENDEDDEEDDDTDDEGEWEYVNDDEDEIVIDDESGEEDEDDEEEVEEEEDEDEDDEDDDDDDEEEDDEEGSDDDDSASNNEAAEDDENVAQSSNKDRKRLDMTRVLSAEDFALLEKLKLAAAERAKDPKYRNKISIKDETEDGDALEDDGGDSKPDPSANLPFNVEPTSLTPGMKVNKLTKIERISHVLKGRKESKWEHEGHAGGLTNKEKERKKNYVMVRKGKKSVANKIRKSNSEVRWDKMHKKEIWGRDKRKRRRT